MIIYAGTDMPYLNTLELLLDFNPTMPHCSREMLSDFYRWEAETEGRSNDLCKVTQGVCGS